WPWILLDHTGYWAVPATPVGNGHLAVGRFVAALCLPWRHRGRDSGRAPLDRLFGRIRRGRWRRDRNGDRLLGACRRAVRVCPADRRPTVWGRRSCVPHRRARRAWGVPLVSPLPNSRQPPTAARGTGGVRRVRRPTRRSRGRESLAHP